MNSINKIPKHNPLKCDTMILAIDVLSSDYSTSDDLQTALYAVVKGDVENPEELKQVQKKFLGTI